MRIWFARELETVATFWRVLRRDGVALGFTSHDHDLWFDGILHLASPGMVPSAIKRTADFEPDSAEVEGALSHDAITTRDLALGRYDGAQVRIGVVDWLTLEREILYRGTIGAIVEEDARFTAELQSRKIELLRDPVPRTSPTCRAEFAGQGCALNPVLYTHEDLVVAIDLDRNAIQLAGERDPLLLVGGTLRWFAGPQTGITMTVMMADDPWLILDTPLDPAAAIDIAVLVREGCDRTLATCATRFGNAVNFRGEPFLPGNDLISRYPAPPR